MSHYHDRDDARFDEHGNTRPTGSNYIADDKSDDGLDRRGFLRCMAWAGTATLWGLAGGIPVSFRPNRLRYLTEAERKSIFFAQISDSHIGFNKDANKDVTATLQEAVARLNSLPQAPALVLHTGDITQLAKAEEFDTANEVLKGVRTDRIFFLPRSLREEHEGQRLVQLRPLRRALHWSRERAQSQSRRARIAWCDANRLAPQRRVRTFEQHADSAVCARAALDRLSGVGLGHRRFRAGAGSAEAFWIGDGSERTHPSDHAESGGQHRVSHRDVDRVSAAGARYGVRAWADEGRTREAQERARRHRRNVHSWPQHTRCRRCNAVGSSAGVRRRNSRRNDAAPDGAKESRSRCKRNRHRQFQIHSSDPHCESGDEGRVDQQRRRSAPHRERREQVQAVARARHRPAVCGDTYEA